MCGITLSYLFVESCAKYSGRRSKLACVFLTMVNIEKLCVIEADNSQPRIIALVMSPDRT